MKCKAVLPKAKKKDPMQFSKNYLFAATAIALSLVQLGCNDTTSTPGAASTLQCTSSGKNAYDTYGLNAFVAVNKQIIQNVGSEMSANGTANLGTAFTKIGSGNPPSTSDNAQTFEGSLAAFLVFTYGGPYQITYVDGVNYFGPQDMPSAHAGLNITSSQYDYFVNDIIVPALTTKGVTMADVSSCFAPALTSASFKASIVGQ
jgi:hypothetical protein